jgi:hypothetical protein
MENTLQIGQQADRAGPPRKKPRGKPFAGKDDPRLRQNVGRMQSDYRSIKMAHWLKDRDSFTSHHLLGGYALFQQQFPEEVLEKRLAMFLQVGTDANAGMEWSDGGELTFYADARALAKGRLERLWGTCQGG